MVVDPFSEEVVEVGEDSKDSTEGVGTNMVYLEEPGDRWVQVPQHSQAHPSILEGV